MKKPKQLSFSFIKEKKNTAWLQSPLRFCKRTSVLLLVAQVILSCGRIWILTN